MTILFYPHLPKPHNRMYRLCKELEINFHNNPKKDHNIVFYWSYNQTIYKPDKFIRNHKRAINRGCFDITKSKVNEVFGSKFVDPTKIWPHVRKSEHQGRHDGVIFNCPQKPKKGFVYQKYIDSSGFDESYSDLRIFWSGQIDFIVRKNKRSIFKNDIIECFYEKPDYIFTDEQEKEISKKIIDFGLNFGEVDFLLDDDGPVIIDVNNVPGRGIFKFLEESAWEYYKSTFKAFIERWPNLGGFSLGHNAFDTIRLNCGFGRVLELGSGKGSIPLSKCCQKLYSIEDNPKFVKSYKGGTCYHVPIKDGWYDVDILNQVLEQLDYDFIIMDGPAKANRVKFFDNFHLFKQVPFLIDDTHKPMGKELVRLFHGVGYEFEYIEEVDKQSAICLNVK